MGVTLTDDLVTDLVRGSLNTWGDGQPAPGGVTIFPTGTPVLVGNFGAGISAAHTLVGTETLSNPAVQYPNLTAAALRVTCGSASDAGGAYISYANAGIASNVYSGTALFKGTAGAGYTVNLYGNGGAVRGTKAFTATGNVQLVTITATMSSDSNATFIVQRQSRAGVESFDLLSMQIQPGPAIPYVGAGVTSRTGGRITAPVSASGVSFLGVTQRVLVLGLVMLVGSGGDGTTRTLFRWGSGSNLFSLAINTTGGIVATATQAGTPVTATVTPTYNPGDFVSVVIQWTATNIQVAAKGGTLTVSAVGASPTIADSTFDLGSAGGSGQAAATLLWLGIGTGQVVNADSAAIQAWSPRWPGFPVRTALWDQLAALNGATFAPTFTYFAEATRDAMQRSMTYLPASAPLGSGLWVPGIPAATGTVQADDAMITGLVASGLYS